MIQNSLFYNSYVNVEIDEIITSIIFYRNEIEQIISIVDSLGDLSNNIQSIIFNNKKN